jgi:hypothetical protein
VLVDSTTDELDVVNVVGGGVVVKTEAEVDELEPAADSDVKIESELDREEIAAEMLEISEEDEVTTGTMLVEEEVDIVLVETLVEVLVITSVVELVDDSVTVEVDESDVIVDVESVVKEDTLELVMVTVEDVTLVDRLDMDWPSTKTIRSQSSNAPWNIPKSAIALDQKHSSMAREEKGKNEAQGGQLPRRV